MGLQTEVWARDIKEKLFPEDSFMNQAVNDDPWVNHKTVHLPQAGALPEVVRDRGSYPAAPSQRVDTVTEYTLHEYTSTPTHIADIEEVETSYAKRNSVVTSHGTEINKLIANWMAYEWAPDLAANLVRTTGSDRDTNVIGATGTRKDLTIEDIMSAKRIMDDMDLPAMGRNMLLPAHMYNNLIEANWKDLLAMETTGRARIADGNLLVILGFNIFLRGKKNILTYDNAATPVKRDPQAAVLATANAAALCWHKDFVRRARGAVKVYNKIDDPSYYGSIFSAMARAGGRKAYADGTGVVSIIEAA